jgi:hypothetical protein
MNLKTIDAEIYAVYCEKMMKEKMKANTQYNKISNK